VVTENAWTKFEKLLMAISLLGNSMEHHPYLNCCCWRFGEKEKERPAAPTITPATFHPAAATLHPKIHSPLHTPSPSHNPQHARLETKRQPPNANSNFNFFFFCYWRQQDFYKPNAISNFIICEQNFTNQHGRRIVGIEDYGAEIDRILVVNFAC